MEELESTSSRPARGKTTRAKYRPPGTSGLLPRPRLMGLLSEAIDRGTIPWLTGAPGCGKSAAAAQFAATQPYPVHWLRLDEHDLQPDRFALSLAQALGVTPSLGNDSAVDRLDEVVALAHWPALLVLDAYDHGDADKLDPMILALVDALPAEARLVIAGRAEPQDGFAHLFAYRRCTRVGWQQLRFTEDEMTSLCVRDGVHDAQEVHRMVASAAGWITGLQLLLPPGNANRDGVRVRSRALLGPYVERHVLSGLSDPQRDWFARASLTPRVCESSVLHLTGEDRIAEVVEPLAAREWFVECFDGAAGGFKLHPLLRFGLQERLRLRLEAPARADLYAKAAVWLEERGDREDALRIREEIATWPEMEINLVALAPALIAGDRMDELVAWIQRLPGGRPHHPWLQYWLGMARARIDPSDAKALFEAAWHKFVALDDAVGQALVCAARLDCHFASREKPETLPLWLDRLLSAWESGADQGDAATQAGILAHGTEVLRRRFGHPVLARWVARALELRCEAEASGVREKLTLFCAAYHYWMGDAAQAAAILGTASQSAEPSVAGLASALIADYVVSQAPDRSRTRNGVPSLSLKEWDRRTLELFVDPPVLGPALLPLGYDIIATRADRNPPPGLAGKALFERRIAELVERGVFLEASRVQVLAIQDERPAGGSLNLARLNLRGGQLHSLARECRKALEQFDEALELARGIRADFLCWQIQLWRAHCLYDLGRSDAADEALIEAVHLGAQMGTTDNHPWWPPGAQARLAARALELGLDRDYVHRWIRARDLLPPSANLEHWPWTLRIYTLGRFSIVADGVNLVFHGKAQKKPLDLLKAAIALGGRDIAVNILIETLWADAEGDAARKSFDVALLRLRRLLGRDDAVCINDGKLSINAKPCWVDLVSVERLIGAADRILETTGRHRATLDALSRYRGAFLQLDEPQPWMTATRERLAGKIRRLVLSAGTALEDERRLHEAIGLYQRAIEVQPSSEVLYRRLILCHARTGDHDEARAVLERCRRVMADLCGTQLAKETELACAVLPDWEG